MRWEKLLVFGFLLSLFLAGCATIAGTTGISELNKNLGQYLNKSVTVEGYFGYKGYHGSTGYHILIEDYDQFSIREQLPLYTYALIDDSNDPMSKDLEGKKLRVTGTVSKYDGYSVTPLAVIKADSFEVVG